MALASFRTSRDRAAPGGSLQLRRVLGRTPSVDPQRSVLSSASVRLAQPVHVDVVRESGDGLGGIVPSPSRYPVEFRGHVFRARCLVHLIPQPVPQPGAALRSAGSLELASPSLRGLLSDRDETTETYAAGHAALRLLSAMLPSGLCCPVGSRDFLISRPNHTTRSLAVYASPPRLLETAQDSLPTFGADWSGGTSTRWAHHLVSAGLVYMASSRSRLSGRTAQARRGSRAQRSGTK